MPLAEMLAKRPEGDHPLRWSRVGARRRRAVDRPGDLRRRRPRPRHLLRRAARRARPRRRGRAAPGRGEYGRTPLSRTGAGSVLLGEQPDEQVRLDEPRRHDHRRAAGFVVVGQLPGTRPSPRSGPRPRDLRRAVPPRGRAHRARPGDPRGVPVRRVPAAGRRGRTSSIIEQAVDEVRAQVGDERVICGLVGRRRLRGRGRARAQGDRRPAHLRVRRHRAAAPGRGRAGRGDVPPPVQHRPGPREGGRPVPRRARRHRQDPERKRKIIGETFIRVFEEVARDVDDAAFLVQGTLYPDIVESGGERQRHHQEPPQRRRPPRRHGLRAGRAAAPAVQGRGARRRRGARAARGDRLAPAVPRPRSRGAHHRDDHARAGRDPARGRRDRRRGDPAGGPLPGDLAELRGAAGGAHRRRDG